MKKVLRVILIAVIAIIVVGTFVMLWQKSRPEKIEYESVEVKRDTILVTSVATGKIAPRDEILIKPQISGIISELMKEAGDFVRVGEIIALVKVIPEMTQLNSAESRVTVAKIDFERVELEYNRQKELFERGVISLQEMQEMTATYKKSEEELANSISNMEIIRDGISRRSMQASNTQIRSTITGMILDVPIKVGNSVIMSNTFNDGTTIASIADMNDILFIGDIDETEVGRMRTGMPLKLTIGAIDNMKFDAVLEYISPKGVEDNGAIMFEIKAAAEIPDSVTVRAEYSANAEVVLQSAENVLVVAENTLHFEGDSTFVYKVIDGTDEYEKTEIKIGISSGILVEVKSGLEEGDKVRGNQILAKPKK